MLIGRSNSKIKPEMKSLKMFCKPKQRLRAWRISLFPFSIRPRTSGGAFDCFAGAKVCGRRFLGGNRMGFRLLPVRRPGQQTEDYHNQR